MRLRTLVVAGLAIAITGTVAPAAHAAPTASELTKKIDKASDELEDIVESYNDMKLNLKKTEAAEKKLAAEVGPAKEKLDAASAEMKVVAGSAYKVGQVGTMNVILESGDSDSLMERLSLLEQLSRNRQKDIDTYTEATKGYTERQAALETTRTKQTAQVKELETRKKKIESEIDDLYEMREAAYGSATETGSAYTGEIPSVSGSAGAAVTFAFNQIGKMYEYGADGPETYDCSGLTSKAWAAAGKSLAHSAATQYSQTTRISRSQLKAGDLVFYRNNGHVALYVGDGMIIDASRTGEPVKHRSIDIMTPNGYGRVS